MVEGIETKTSSETTIRLQEAPETTITTNLQAVRSIRLVRRMPKISGITLASMRSRMSKCKSRTEVADSNANSNSSLTRRSKALKEANTEKLEVVKLPLVITITIIPTQISRSQAVKKEVMAAVAALRQEVLKGSHNTPPVTTRL